MQDTQVETVEAVKKIIKFFVVISGANTNSERKKSSHHRERGKDSHCIRLRRICINSNSASLYNADGYGRPTNLAALVVRRYFFK